MDTLNQQAPELARLRRLKALCRLASTPAYDTAGPDNLGACCIEFVVRDVSVHEAQNRSINEMRSLVRNEMQLIRHPGPASHSCHLPGVAIVIVVRKTWMSANR
jgi:hypothetical protein